MPISSGWLMLSFLYLKIWIRFMLFLFFVFCLAFLMCVSIVILALYQKTKRCSYYVWAYSQWGVLLILVSIKWQLEIFFAVQEEKHTRQTHKKINKNIQGSNGKPLDIFRNSSNYFFYRKNFLLLLSQIRQIQIHV